MIFSFSHRPFHILKLLAFTAIGAFLSIGVSINTFAAAISVHALDSIAGYGSDISITNATPNKTVSIFITPPIGGVFEIEKKADQSGSIQFALPEKYVENAGSYSITAVSKGLSAEDGPRTLFEIFPDDPSDTHSKIETKNISTAVGENTTLTVFLKDAYSNPVRDHRVRIISSRAEDTITPLDTHTNNRGEIQFTVSSSIEGSSTFTAIDDTSDTTISDRTDILFYENGTKKLSQGNNPYAASLVSSTSAASEELYGTLHSFSIDFPTQVTVNSDENYLTIQAQDSQERRIKNFVGSIIIRVPTDPNAELPGNDGKYLFLSKDQGKFTFPRSIVFSQTGTHQLEVFAYDEQTQEINTSIYGKKTITVEEKTGNPISIGSDNISIVSPSNGSKFSTPTISIRGEALPDTDVKIFLDNIPVKEVAVNEKGIFTLTLDELEDGKHFLYAMQKQGEREASEEISITIDTNGANVTDMSIAPAKVFPGDDVTITILAEENLQSVEASWDDEKEFLSEEEDGKYQLTFSAPTLPGTYPISIILKDENNNSVEKSIDTPLIVQTQNTNISATLSGTFQVASQEFHLSWETLQSNTSPILYIIKAGETRDSMKKIKSISGLQNTAKIDTLEIGKSYIFSVIPVLSTGEEADESNTVELQSFAAPTPTPLPTQMPVITPAPTPVIPSAKTFQAIGKQNSIELTWEHFPGTQQYQISYGIAPGSYAETKTVTQNQNTITLNDLIASQPYYIQIRAKDALGFQAYHYGEKSASPLGNSFHPAPTSAPIPYPEWIVESGASLYLLLGSILLLGGGLLLGRKRV